MASKAPSLKTPKSETLTVRLDPQLRYLAELAARKQRRSLSSFIEWAVEASLKNVALYEGSGYNGDHSTFIADEMASLWDIDESERFVKLAMNYPALLTQEEQKKWKLLNDSQLLAPAKQRDMSGMILWNRSIMEDRVCPVIRQIWDELNSVFEDSTQAQLDWVRRNRIKVEKGETYPGFKPPATPQKSSSGFDDMDDEIPF